MPLCFQTLPQSQPKECCFSKQPQKSLNILGTFQKKLAQELSKLAQSSHTVDGVTSVASELMYFKDKYIHYLQHCLGFPITWVRFDQIKSVKPDFSCRYCEISPYKVNDCSLSWGIFAFCAKLKRSRINFLLSFSFVRPELHFQSKSINIYDSL